MEQFFNLLDLTFEKMIKIGNLLFSILLATTLGFSYNSQSFINKQNALLFIVSVGIWAVFGFLLTTIGYYIGVFIYNKFMKKISIQSGLLEKLLKVIRVDTPENDLKIMLAGAQFINNKMFAVAALAVQSYFIWQNNYVLLVAMLLFTLSVFSISVEKQLQNTKNT